jgi:hypothetical protein
VTAWDITNGLVAPLPAIPAAITSGTLPVVTNQAEIDAATLLRNEELQQHALLESAAVSTLIAGVSDTMIHHIDQNDANGTWLLLA